QKKPTHSALECIIIFRRDEVENTVSYKNFVQFLNTFQRDPRLNEVDHPRMSERMMKKRLEAIGHLSGTGVTFQAFVHFLWSDFCTDSLNMSIEEVTDMMHAPLSHYFINSSHNTYCKGLQVKVAKILHSVQVIVAARYTKFCLQVLLSGCRCVELDVWDGPHGPVVTHGPSIVMRMNEVLLKDVCVAIAESAFKTSPYPVLLSIENHLSKQQQRQMVAIFRQTFREHLLDRPLPNHVVSSKEYTPLPSPNVLRKKILIKAKRRRDHEDNENLDDDRKSSIASSVSEVSVARSARQVHFGSLRLSCGFRCADLRNPPWKCRKWLKTAFFKVPHFQPGRMRQFPAN
ncbi:unnamed protein product, partial [Cylicostephanus goldi]